jgi:hypothetical protein
LDFLKSVYSFATEFVEKPVSASLEYARGLVLGLLDAGLGSVQSIAQALANDPPDPNYRQIAVPSSETIAPDLSFAGSLGAQAATTINKEGYYVQALALALLAYERYQGAIAADDVVAALTQLSEYKLELAAAQAYSAELATDIAALDAAFLAAGLPNYSARTYSRIIRRP